MTAGPVGPNNGTNFMSEEEQRLTDALEQAINLLREHCDSVRIFVTKESDDGNADTIALTDGRGNWYAQKGQIVDWLENKPEDRRHE